MASSQMTLQSAALRPQLLGSPVTAQPATLSGSSSRASLTVRAAGMKWDRLLGGRGLVSEDVLKDKTKANEVLWSQPVKSPSTEERTKLDVPEDAVGDAFDKELSGLTGGFPGGEKGLKKFIQEFPLPKGSTISPELEKARQQLAATAAATAVRGAPGPITPPLLMPGMTVLVKNPKESYYQFSGIVQRITDGRVAVLFEGGNWDKLVTFDLADLERTKKGPPGSNPKSASLSLNPLFSKQA